MKPRGQQQQQLPPALAAVAPRRSETVIDGDAGRAGDVGDGGVDTTAPTEIQRAASMGDQVWAMLRPDMPRILLSVAWAMVGTAFALAGPLAYSGVVSAVLESLASPKKASARLGGAVAMLGLVYTVEPIVTVLYIRGMSGVVDRAAARLKVQAFRSLLAQEVAFFDLAGSSELSAAVTTDILAVKSAVQGNLQKDRGLRAMLEMVFGLVVLVKLSPRLAWLFALVIPTASWGLAESRKRLSSLGEVENKSLAMEAAIASEAVRNIREVRSFGAESRELARFQAATFDSSNVSSKIGEQTGHLEALNRAVINVSIVAVLFFGGRLVAAGQLSAPLLLSFIGFCFSLNFAMQGVNFTLTDLKRGQAALGRVLQVMTPSGNSARTTGVDVISPRDFEGRVELRKVHFTYPTRPDVPVFSGLDLTLPAGKVTALVGLSGGGKSTIAALLSRFYTPTRGDILVDGVPVDDLDRKWLTQKIALVGQNPALFTGTIAQNIAYGLSATTNMANTNKGTSAEADDAGGGGGGSDGDGHEGVGHGGLGVSMEKVVEAAELANAKDFIQGFPDGFDTFIGEGGVQLSGGQRQRIAIARAVLKNARILLLDEATSALDARSEALVQEALNRLMKDRTVLIIAHRLSTVVDADKICVLSQGKVTEEGTHSELLERKGAYSQLMNTQVQRFSIVSD